MTEKKIYGFFDDTLWDYPSFKRTIRNAFPSILFISDNIGPHSIRKLLKDGHTVIRLSRNNEDTSYRASWCTWGVYYAISNSSCTSIIEFISKRLAGDL